MNLKSEMELKAGMLRTCALALFAVISGALWIGFAVDTYFASDGSFYFAIILDNGRFTNISPSRAHAELISQWFLVQAVRSGVSDLEVLELIFGLGIWFPWVLGFVVSLYATRDRPALIFFYLISLASLNLAGWSLIYGEHMVLLSIAWPIFYLSISKKALNVLEQILVLALLMLHMRLYETTIVSGSIFALIFAFRAWMASSQRERWGSALFAILALASVCIAANWILFPRDVNNRGNFLGAIIGSLAHPYPWMGLSFVIFSTWGYLFSSSKAFWAGWVTPLTIGICSLPFTGIWGGVAFSTRTLTLTALPLLMLLAGGASLSNFAFTKKWAVSVAALVVGLSFLHVRHLQSWAEFRSDFKAVLKEEEGFVKPEDYDDLDHWGWTNTILSYVWSEGEVKALILNPADMGYEPYPVRTEMLLEDYLLEKPSFLDKVEEEDDLEE